MASVVPRLAPGSTFAERYRIVSHLGQGSTGSVYRAEPLEGGAALALKIVNLDVAKDPRSVKRFQREVESGGRIDSVHVVRTLDSGNLGGAGGGLAWLAMELVDGPDLAELLRSGPSIDAVAARRLLEQLFAALSAAHAVGIVHRDLKPENVRVSGSGAAMRVKVLDFGIAKDIGVSTFSGTSPGLGTPLWTAPEQTREGYRPVPNADVWALGLLTFFVLTGAFYWRHAAERASMADLAMELIKGEIVPASARAVELGVGGLPAGFDGWFEQAVQRNPERRYVDAAEAWAALAPLLGDGDMTEPRVAARPSVVVRPGVFLTLVILSVVGAGLTIYWLLRSMRI